MRRLVDYTCTLACTPAGKTTSARVISIQAAVPLVYLPLEAVLSKWYGESEGQLAQVGGDEGQDIQGAAMRDASGVWPWDIGLVMFGSIGLPDVPDVWVYWVYWAAWPCVATLKSGLSVCRWGWAGSIPTSHVGSVS